jgi:threonylcarbamoyladenosine tRNA methylthiotransferase MtaB
MRVCFKTFGCRLNQAETAEYEALFRLNGVDTVAFDSECDVCVIHSCSVTGRAERECLRAVSAVKRKNPATLAVLTGCAVESADAGRLAALGIDLIVARRDKPRLVEIILTALSQACVQPCGTPVLPFFQTHRALLKIQDGCDYFCAYCIIPHNRGAPVSRSYTECLNLARAFIDKGFQEIVITGCNIASFKSEGKTLPDLLKAVAELPNIGRVRCGSLEPGTVELQVAQLIGDLPTICPFLHLPLQSCDDRTLARMNRRYRSAEMRAVIEQILKRTPRIALGSDIITGFPGEDEAAFVGTLSFIAEYPFSNLHVFPYSERSGTPAAEFGDRVAPAIRKERARRLIALGERKRRDYAATWIGREAEVLVEKVDERNCARGWSAEYLPCRVEGFSRQRGSDLRGGILRFKPHGVENDTLIGQTAPP